MPKDEDSEEQDEDELTEEILSVYGTEDDIEPYKKVLERNDTSGKTERCSGVRETSPSVLRSSSSDLASLMTVKQKRDFGINYSVGTVTPGVA